MEGSSLSQRQWGSGGGGRGIRRNISKYIGKEKFFLGVDGAARPCTGGVGSRGGGIKVKKTQGLSGGCALTNFTNSRKRRKWAGGEDGGKDLSKGGQFRF